MFFQGTEYLFLDPRFFLIPYTSVWNNPPQLLSKFPYRQITACVIRCRAVVIRHLFWPLAPSSSQQAPDYRLYKSEPELTTVKEEVDEANGEDKDKTESESKDTPASKGTLRISHNTFTFFTLRPHDMFWFVGQVLQRTQLSLLFCSPLPWCPWICLRSEKKRKSPEHNVLFVLCSLIRRRMFPAHFGTPLYPQLIRWSTWFILGQIGNFFKKWGK